MSDLSVLNHFLSSTRSGRLPVAHCVIEESPRSRRLFGISEHEKSFVGSDNVNFKTRQVAQARCSTNSQSAHTMTRRQMLTAAIAATATAPAVRLFAQEKRVKIDRIEVFPCRYPMTGFFKFLADPRRVGRAAVIVKSHGGRRDRRVGSERAGRKVELRDARSGDRGAARILCSRADRPRSDRHCRRSQDHGSARSRRLSAPACRSRAPESTSRCTI